MPHLLAADPAATRNPQLRRMACNACRYLLNRGDNRIGYDLARDLREHWRGRLGDDDLDTLEAARHLGSVLRIVGRYADAHDLDRDTLECRRRVPRPPGRPPLRS